MTMETIDTAERDWRYNRIRAAMAALQLDALVIYSPAWRRENIHYLVGAAYDPGIGMGYLPLDGEPAAFAFSLPDAEALRHAGVIDDVRPANLVDAGELVGRIKEDMTRGRIGVAGLEYLPGALWEQVTKALPAMEFTDAGALMDDARLVKSDWEIACLRKAGAVCDSAWQAFLEACRPGAREFEIVAAVEARLREMGAEDNFMLIASGGDEVRGMTPPSDRVLQKGDMVRTELTPRLSGYWAQICRTAVIGRASDAQRKSFDLFEEAVVAGMAAIRPGVTAHEVAMAENDVFRKYGFGEYCTSEYTRVRGHCLGLHLDEAPIIEGRRTVLEKNAVLIVHPNTYTPLAGYHVLGDPVVVTETGAEKLLATPRRLDEVPG